MFMNSIIYFEIQSSQPQREMAFYTQLFGWTFFKADELAIEYYRIITPSITGGILKRQAPRSSEAAGTNAFTCSIQVESFDKTAERILALGGKIALEKFRVPSRCWQGYFLDPDHNVFGICEIDESDDALSNDSDIS